MSSFGDDQLSHLVRIRDALWQPAGGRVSVMVGAGLSRNAIALDPGKPNIPDWKGLSLRLCEQLVPAATARASVIDDMGAVAEGYMRLAQYFEAKFGRTLLDQFIVQSVSDSLFQPGPIHRELLSLPWLEVFTTNWDTLLERAASEIADPLYFPVADQTQLLTAGVPRITKLHGCVERNRHFIFTEEDYRTYPKTRAAFVTVVRKALLDGPLCLVGFSGEDPNFRQWIGWIRDTMPSQHPLYLVDVLATPMADFQVARLRNQGVTVLSLGTANTDPAQSLSRVLQFLDEGRVRSWPGVLRNLPNDESNGESVAEATIAARDAYPGWLLCPAHYRSILLARMRYSSAKPLGIAAITSKRVKYMSARADLLTWLGTGLFTADADAVDECLEWALRNSDARNPPSSDVLALAFDRMSQCRHDLDWPAYRSARNRAVTLVVHAGSRAKELLALEDVLASITRLDIERARREVSSFRSSDPFLQLRALSLSIELGLDTSVGSTFESLSKHVTKLVREHPFSERYASLEDAVRHVASNWDWAGRLLKPAQVEHEKEFDSRSQRRRGLECDLANELFLLGAILEHPPSTIETGERPRIPFRASTFSTTFRFSDDLPPGLIPAYLVARCPELAGLPVSAGGVGLLTSLLEDAARWLLRLDPPAGLNLVLRLLVSGRDKIVRDEISRASVALMPIDQARWVWTNVIEALRAGLERGAMHRKHRDHAFFSGCLHLASKLVIRLDEEAGRILVDFSLDSAWDAQPSDEALAADRSFGLSEASHVVSGAYLASALEIAARRAFSAREQGFGLAELLTFSVMRISDMPATEWEWVPQLVERLSSGSEREKVAALYLVAVADSCGALNAEVIERVGDALWQTGQWPILGKINRQFVVKWPGRNPTVLRSLLEAELSDSKTSEATVLAAAMLITYAEAHPTAINLASELTAEQLEKVALSVEAMAEERVHRRSFGGTDFSEAWSDVLSNLVARSRVRSNDQVAAIIATSKKSDLWRPIIPVLLLEHGYANESDVLDALLNRSFGSTHEDWYLVSAIRSFLLSPIEAHASFGDRDTVLRELTSRIRQRPSVEASHAIAVAATIAKESPDSLSRSVQSSWLSAALEHAQLGYGGTGGQAIEFVPSLRRSTARLLAALLKIDPDKLNDAGVKIALNSFRTDPLPEVRLEVPPDQSDAKQVEEKDGS